MKKAHGFTLVELLVSIAIFAVLTAAGWKVFDQLLKTRERNQQHATHLMQVQTAYAQMLRDLSQIVPIAGQVGGEVYPALKLQSEYIALNKSGVIDPLQQQLDDFEFVEYRFDPEKQALVRAKLPHIYRQQQIPQEDIVLVPIENLRFQALDPQAQQQWPDQVVTAVGAAEYQLLQLPKGVEVTFDFQGKPYRWVYSLINTPKAAQADENIASETSGAN